MHPARCSLVFGGLLLAASICAAQPAEKRVDKSRESSLGNARSDAPILSRDELRACLDEQEALRKQAAEALEEQRGLDEEKAHIGQRKSELNEALATLDRTSQAAVDAHNVRAQELDARITDYNTKSAPFNARAGALNAQRQGWERNCASRRYREDDLILIKARR